MTHNGNNFSLHKLFNEVRKAYPEADRRPEFVDAMVEATDPKVYEHAYRQALAMAAHVLENGVKRRAMQPIEKPEPILTPSQTASAAPERTSAPKVYISETTGKKYVSRRVQHFNEVSRPEFLAARAAAESEAKLAPKKAARAD